MALQPYITDFQLALEAVCQEHAYSPCPHAQKVEKNTVWSKQSASLNLVQPSQTAGNTFDGFNGTVYF